MLDFSLLLNWDTGLGTFVSTTSFTDIEEWGDSDQFPYTNARSAPALFGFDGTQTILLSTLEVEVSINGTLVGSAQAVPEPGTATLVSLGLATLTLARARRR